MFRTLALYIVAAWVLMQVADVLLPALALPEASIRYVLFAAIAGFPLALVFGWFFDITSGGIRLTEAGDSELVEVQALQLPDYLILGALLVVLALIGYGLSDAVLERPGELAVDSSSGGEARREGPPMVGVLPFAHMGSGEDGDFFASGIHDDLLTRLAKLQGLRVVSRTSVMGYADTSKKIPEIGRELRADAILEGGVRVAGDQIRINAQLIDARSDEHLWAETYDRRLTASNIFEVQSEIARAIAGALKATLTPDDSAELALIPTQNMAAYRIFHKTMQWRDTVTLSMNSQNEQRYLDGLREAVELDPQFTRPMVELLAYLSLSVYSRNASELLPEVEALIERIAAVAPDSADYYAAQSLYFYYVLRDFDRAEVLLAQAEKKAPSDTRLVEIESWIKRRQGDFDGWLAASKRAWDLDPRNEKLQSRYGTRLMTMHRYDEAERTLLPIEHLPAGQRWLALLRLRKHHDTQRYAQELRRALEFLKGRRRITALNQLWEAQLAARDEAGIERTVDELVATLKKNPRTVDAASSRYIPFELSVQLGHAMISGDEQGAGELLAEIAEVMELQALAPADYPARIQPLDRASLALAAGEPDVASALANAYWQDPSLDRAEWLGRGFACSMLGMAGAAEDAVTCMRNAFEEPSQVHPFLEPLLPTYDSIRETPPFRALVDDLVSEGWLEPR